MSSIRLVDRDYTILNEIFRWRIITGKHLCKLAGFTGQRACDRRLAKLVNAKIIKREKIIYGFPGIYSLTSKGNALIGVPNKKERIRIEQIFHDSIVIDTAIYFHLKKGVLYKDIVTEKQLHIKDGFGKRQHQPDFVFTQEEKTNCVEIELSLKSKDRFEKNIINNFKNYHTQFWVVPDLHNKIYTFLSDAERRYPNIEILELAEVKK